MDQPAWAEKIENPYLQGIHAPVSGETTASDLVVKGELPSDLFGAHLRNGPNSVHAPSNQYHWFDGDGMVHGIYFRDGQASYRSRWVRPAGLADETAKGESIWPGVMGPFDLAAPRHYLKDTANTDLIWHADQLLALW
ncbi:MAG: carotenoid oxygenase family protein, partial [Candidatus Poseidoniia archaeon]